MAASSAIALVVAALVMVASSLVLGPRSASTPEHLGFDLSSDPSSFTITSNIYPSPACSGSTALLGPGQTRCVVFSVHNNETVSLGAGSYNAYFGAPGKTNVCHLPTPPASWHGTAAAYYHDTITNCTVVTP